MTSEIITIRYRRPPDNIESFRQRLVHRSDDVVVTLLDAVQLERPRTIDGSLALEPGAPIVWFTLPGTWHDVGRFHDAAGRFTGLYANVLTPVVFHSPAEWETTDLFLDVWLPPDRPPRVLDEDELVEAQRRGWLTPELATRARAEARRIVSRAATGAWPRPAVHAWTLDAVRAALGKPDRGSEV